MEDLVESLDYEKDLRIDESALDVEWLEQPSLMFNYCRHAAAVKRLMLRSKEKIEVMSAELENRIRFDPRTFGLSKLTEGGVQSILLTDPDLQAARIEYVQVSYEHDMAQAAVRSIDQKKTALENLVKLYQSNYFSGPVAPRDLPVELRKKTVQKSADSKINIRMSSRNKQEKEKKK